MASVNLGWHLAEDIKSQHQDNNNISPSTKEEDREGKSEDADLHQHWRSFTARL